MGSTHSRKRRLTDQNARDVRDMIWKDGLTLREVAETYKVSIQTIWQIKIEQTYKQAL